MKIINLLLLSVTIFTSSCASDPEKAIFQKEIDIQDENREWLLKETVAKGFTLINADEEISFKAPVFRSEKVSHVNGFVGIALRSKFYLQHTFVFVSDDEQYLNYDIGANQKDIGDIIRVRLEGQSIQYSLKHNQIVRVEAGSLIKSLKFDKDGFVPYEFGDSIESTFTKEPFDGPDNVSREAIRFEFKDYMQSLDDTNFKSITIVPGYGLVNIEFINGNKLTAVL